MQNARSKKVLMPLPCPSTSSMPRRQSWDHVTGVTTIDPPLTYTNPACIISILVHYYILVRRCVGVKAHEGEISVLLHAPVHSFGQDHSPWRGSTRRPNLVPGLRSNAARERGIRIGTAGSRRAHWLDARIHIGRSATTHACHCTLRSGPDLDRRFAVAWTDSSVTATLRAVSFSFVLLWSVERAT